MSRRSRSRHSGAVYEPTGPETLTQVDQARIIGEMLGRELTFEEQDPEPVRQMLGRCMNAGMVDSLFSLMAASAETPARVTSVVETVAGRSAPYVRRRIPPSDRDRIRPVLGAIVSSRTVPPEAMIEV